MKKFIVTVMLTAALSGCATYSEQDRINLQTANFLRAIGYSHSVENLRSDMAVFYGK